MVKPNIPGNSQATQYDLKFARGFLYSLNPVFVPPNFVGAKSRLPIFLHPLTTFAEASKGNQIVAVVGTMLDPDRPELGPSGVAEMLLENIGDLQRHIDRCIGRFAVFWQDAGSRGFQIDAMGLRSAFCRIEENQVTVASHARLTMLASGESKQRPIRYRWGYPGISTPFANVIRMNPNARLEFETGRFVRFFPVKPIPQQSIEVAWDLAFRRAEQAAEALARRDGKIVLSLTAGLDSRTTLSVTQELWSNIDFFTYNHAEQHKIDLRIASKIADCYDLHFLHLGSQTEDDIPESMKKLFRNNTFLSHNRAVAYAYSEVFPVSTFHIRSNLLELFRSNLFQKGHSDSRFRDGLQGSKELTDYYCSKLPGKNKTNAKYQNYFEEMCEVFDWKGGVAFASSWDLFFVEHRMAAWQGGVALECDVAFETVFLFNSREIIRAFMGVPQEVRAKSGYLKKVLKRRLPEISDIPINPRQFSYPVPERGNWR
ncbi:hypothetical protein ACSQ76_04290 [Roseovarius sp. B08]|uniref:hypothetical protein n=1 Tax=Roseovarius sp. B08 TaxID=3449223 RepID=UPI003EDBE0CC